MRIRCYLDIAAHLEMTSLFLQLSVFMERLLIKHHDLRRHWLLNHIECQAVFVFTLGG